MNIFHKTAPYPPIPLFSSSPPLFSSPSSRMMLFVDVSSSMDMLRGPVRALLSKYKGVPGVEIFGWNHKVTPYTYEELEYGVICAEPFGGGTNPECVVRYLL